MLNTLGSSLKQAIKVTIETMLAVCLFDSNINSDVFSAWLLKDLLPKTPPQSVIIMDNAPFHKRQDIEKAILLHGHTLEYLPFYTPDLNPIEHKWAQAKVLRRRFNCSVQDLFLRPELSQFIGN